VEGHRGAGLSPRQAHVLTLLAQGLVDKEIAAALGISVRTVRGHIHAAMTRLGSRTRAEAVLAALRRNELRFETSESEMRLEASETERSEARLRPGPPRSKLG
jgi:DNA-binding CsgD family transcriptional regulator